MRSAEGGNGAVCLFENLYDYRVHCDGPFLIQNVAVVHLTNYTLLNDCYGK